MSNQSKSLVTFDIYKDEYEIKLRDYHLSEEQSTFASVPLKTILQYGEDQTRSHIVILYDDIPVGYFMFQNWEGVKLYHHNEDALIIQNYSIHKAFQGKGIAQESLFKLDSFVKTHFPNVNEIILVVNHKNTIAQHVYKKSGFEDKGIRAMGPNGELFVYHKFI